MVKDCSGTTDISVDEVEGWYFDAAAVAMIHSLEPAWYTNIAATVRDDKTPGIASSMRA